MKTTEPSDPRNLNVASDLDQEVKLLAERTGISPEEARSLMKETGNFEEALRRLGSRFEAEPRPT